VIILKHRSDSQILDDFAFLYNTYKKQGLLPKEIKEIMINNFGFNSESRYYKLLRKCRETGLITDSYKENRQIMIERLKKDQAKKEPEIEINLKGVENKFISFIKSILKKLRIYG